MNERHDEIDGLFAGFEPGQFGDDFSSQVVSRVEKRRNQEAAIGPLFLRTGLAAAMLVLGLMSYNLTVSDEGDVLERLFGVPPSTTVLEAYSHDIDTAI